MRLRHSREGHVRNPGSQYDPLSEFVLQLHTDHHRQNYKHLGGQWCRLATSRRHQSPCAGRRFVDIKVKFLQVLRSTNKLEGAGKRNQTCPRMEKSTGNSEFIKRFAAGQKLSSIWVQHFRIVQIIGSSQRSGNILSTKKFPPRHHSNRSLSQPPIQPLRCTLRIAGFSIWRSGGSS